MTQIKAIMILEILGKPPEHIKEILEKMIETLIKEKDVKVIHSKVAEPKQQQGEIFTSFAEIELETTLDKLMLLIFAYMPSHLEIIEPENLEIKNTDINSFFSEMMRKLHQYDEIAKTMLIERENLARAIQEGKIIVQKQDEQETGQPVEQEKKLRKKKSARKINKKKKK